MESKICTNCNIGKYLKIFRTKIDCQICTSKRSLKLHYEKKDKLSSRRKKHFEKNRNVLLAKSKVNQQSKNMKENFDKQQIKEPNKKLEDLTQAIEMLKTSNS